MQPKDLVRLLDHPEEAERWLAGWGVQDFGRAHANLLRLAMGGVPLDLLSTVAAQLAEHLPRLSDPDMALNNLERFVTSARNPLSLAALFERDPETLPTLLQIFSTSQHLSDLLITDPESFDLLRLTEGEPVAREMLIDDLCSEVEALADAGLVLKALRRFKRRETLRIGYGDIVRGHSLALVTEQISFLADAIVEAAFRAARRKFVARRGQPLRADKQPARFVVLGMGKLGGLELNYSSDIDLIFLYDGDGQTDGPRPISNLEFFNQVARELVRLLIENTDLGQAYRVDLRLRPEGAQGPMVPSREQALRYYDVLGRTWERQAYVKARPVAGDLELGHEFLHELTPWIYRRYLGLADITGIKALKRRIEQRTIHEGADTRNVKTGHGGLRDIEFAIQFLQLLNGGDLPELRTTNTLAAMAALERVGCLTHQERQLLEENYIFLRRIEHRLQFMFDLQTHVLPEHPAEVRKLAIRMGYHDAPGRWALEAFKSDYRRRTALNRKILNHLLHDAFGDDSRAEPEVDLVLDPDPPTARVREVLAPYRFGDVERAYRNLMTLAREKVPFLSTRRCRHFLAAIAPKLLRAIAATPDPDTTLINLEQVSDSLGGKGILWELCSANPPMLHLYVELCATSPLLSGILISNPGMIDELLDSLILNKLPTLPWLQQTLSELCRGAEDLEPILHSFKNAQFLRVGVRDILGKEEIEATTAALSDIAQCCLEQIVASEYEKLVPRLGEPTIGEGPRQGEPCGLAILALGKFGGGELNYHSDLDLVFLYQADGSTVPITRSAASTTNQHFFSELGTRIIKVATHLGPLGRLYEIDARLRPTGRSGSLATSLEEFARYFASGEGQLWERLALCKARVVYGSPAAARQTMEVAYQAAYGRPLTPRDVQGIREMRRRLEESAGPWNLKRGAGGIVDCEFLVQMLRLKHAGNDPRLRDPNTLRALHAMRDAGHLAPDDAQHLASHYLFLRKIESRLRLMQLGARHDMPTNADELARLARVLGYSSGQELVAEYRQHTRDMRERFERICSP
jgi:glutamate-ammonia-ligase adenylyltransferase